MSAVDSIQTRRKIGGIIREGDLADAIIDMKVIAILSIFLCSCAPQWIPDRRPETVDESKAVAELEIKLMEQVPHTLSGHDQDWDDAIHAAHEVAKDTVCKERLYEYRGGARTGKVKEIKP